MKYTGMGRSQLLDLVEHLRRALADEITYFAQDTDEDGGLRKYARCECGAEHPADRYAIVHTGTCPLAYVPPVSGPGVPAPARLDEDRRARPRARLVIKAPAGACIGGHVGANDVEHEDGTKTKL